MYAHICPNLVQMFLNSSKVYIAHGLPKWHSVTLNSTRALSIRARSYSHQVRCIKVELNAHLKRPSISPLTSEPVDVFSSSPRTIMTLNHLHRNSLSPHDYTFLELLSSLSKSRLCLLKTGLRHLQIVSLLDFLSRV